MRQWKEDGEDGSHGRVVGADDGVNTRVLDALNTAAGDGARRCGRALVCRSVRRGGAGVKGNGKERREGKELRLRARIDREEVKRVGERRCGRNRVA